MERHPVILGKLVRRHVEDETVLGKRHGGLAYRFSAHHRIDGEFRLPSRLRRIVLGGEAQRGLPGRNFLRRPVKPGSVRSALRDDGTRGRTDHVDRPAVRSARERREVVRTNRIDGPLEALLAEIDGIGQTISFRVTDGKLTGPGFVRIVIHRHGDLGRTATAFRTDMDPGIGAGAHLPSYRRCNLQRLRVRAIFHKLAGQGMFPDPEAFLYNRESKGLYTVLKFNVSGKTLAAGVVSPRPERKRVTLLLRIRIRGLITRNHFQPFFRIVDAPCNVTGKAEAQRSGTRPGRERFSTFVQTGNTENIFSLRDADGEFHPVTFKNHLILAPASTDKGPDLDVKPVGEKVCRFHKVRRIGFHVIGGRGADDADLALATFRGKIQAALLRRSRLEHKRILLDFDFLAEADAFHRTAKRQRRRAADLCARVIIHDDVDKPVAFVFRSDPLILRIGNDGPSGGTADGERCPEGLIFVLPVPGDEMELIFPFPDIQHIRRLLQGKCFP